MLSSGRADALTYVKINDSDLKAAISRILSTGSSSGSKDDREELKATLDIAARIRPIIELTDARCPMPLKVYNGTSAPLFNIKIVTNERRGASGTRTPTTFHIPYLPAKTYVSGSVKCAIGTAPTYGLYGG